jgi:hypothetical protein
MSVARSLAGPLASSVIDADRGAYYLGSTIPDVRMITRWERERTHFFDLEDFGHQDSVRALFEANPDLSDAGDLNPSTAAFMAGYLTHLVLDEGWITTVYRPLFGEKSALEGSERANVMDRVIQYEMERREREDTPTMIELSGAIAASALEVTVGFIDVETVQRWREVNLDFLKAPPTWERFRNVASRHLRQAGVTEPERIEAFMAEVPSLLQETVDHVGWERVQSYLDESSGRARAAIEDYLS